MADLTLEHLTALAAKPRRVTSDTIALDGEMKKFYLGEFDANELSERVVGLSDNPAAKNLLFSALMVAGSLCDKDRKWFAADTATIIALAQNLEKLPGVALSRLFGHACNINMISPEDIEAIQKKLGKTEPKDGSGG